MNLKPTYEKFVRYTVLQDVISTKEANPVEARCVECLKSQLLAITVIINIYYPFSPLVGKKFTSRQASQRSLFPLTLAVNVPQTLSSFQQDNAYNKLTGTSFEQLSGRCRATVTLRDTLV
ncbi:hypothetical protein TNCV_4171131 [Trichonephila clavipes]|nr:hypothetical protein TNCV_4171131 [Trichonephila clavipes]